jgi:folate-binding protein YgfZ
MATTLLRLAGPDALDLLHRVSTQRLEDVAPGHCRATLFCDFRGRLLHRAIVAVGPDDVVWLLRDDAPAAPLAEFLDRQIFRERIRVEDRSAGGAVVAVPGGLGSTPGTFTERSGAPVELQLDAAWGYRVVGATPIASDRDARPRDGASTERARIAAGRPRHGHEIHEALNPFEVGLAHEIHLDKGCFTGQEALLRMMTYGGVRRALHAVAGPGAPPAPLARLLDGGGNAAGLVTSAVADAEGWIGLAAVRRDAVGSGLALDGGRALGRCEPFPPTRPHGLPEPMR